MSLRKGLLAALLLGSTALPAWAIDYYVAPSGTPSVTNADGSQSKPFATVADALHSGVVRGGDRLLLQAGTHGSITLSGYQFASPVVIESETGQSARVESIAVTGTSKNITFRNLSVWPSNPYSVGMTLLSTSAGASSIAFEGLDVRSGQDAASYPSWSANEWLSRKIAGALLKGDSNKILNSSFTGLNMVISTIGDSALVEGNRVMGFSADAFRAHGDYSVYKSNYASDCVQVDGNHADGFQSWPSVAGGSVKGLVVDSNTIIEWSAATQSPVRCSLQGIGLFDGYYDNIRIVNNLIAVTAAHGISVYGGRGVEIVNNTVVNIKGHAIQYPWIGIFSHKNGTASSNVKFVNNLAMSLGGSNYSTTYRDSNRAILDPAAVFEDFSAHNYVPKPDSGYLDIANPAYAPATDILGNARPSGAAPDAGAYEVGASGATGTTAPPPAPTDTTTTDPAPTDPVVTEDTSTDMTAPDPTPVETADPAATEDSATTEPTPEQTTESVVVDEGAETTEAPRSLDDFLASYEETATTDAGAEAPATEETVAPEAEVEAPVTTDEPVATETTSAEATEPAVVDDSATEESVATVEETAAPVVETVVEETAEPVVEEEPVREARRSPPRSLRDFLSRYRFWW